MNSAKPNKNGEYATKRERNRATVLARAILVPLLLILVFSLTLLTLQTFEVDLGIKKNSNDIINRAMEQKGLVPVAQASDGAEWVNNAASSFASGSGTAGDPYIIKTGAQLAFMAMKVNSTTSYKSKYWKLGANIDLSAHDWSRPIGYNDSSDHYFRGWFDGCGYAIYGMNIPSTMNRDQSGLFGYVYEMGDGNGFGQMTVIENFSLFGNIAFNSSNDGIGGVVGYSKYHVCVRNIAAYVNITSSGNMCPSDGVGGIVGYARMFDADGPSEYNIINNCVSYGTISASGELARVGGIVGQMYIKDDAAIEHGTCCTRTCASFMRITATGKGTNVGGICGEATCETEYKDNHIYLCDVYFAGAISVKTDNDTRCILGWAKRLKSASSWLKAWACLTDCCKINGSVMASFMNADWSGSKDGYGGGYANYNGDCFDWSEGSAPAIMQNRGDYEGGCYGPTWSGSSGTSGGKSTYTAFHTNRWNFYRSYPLPKGCPACPGLGYGAWEYAPRDGAQMNFFAAACNSGVSGKWSAAWSGSQTSTYNAAWVRLYNDITLNDNWTPIASYTGYFGSDGFFSQEEGYWFEPPRYSITIKNITKTSGSNIGFFATTTGAWIAGVKWRLGANWSVSGGNIGVIVGCAKGTTFWWDRVTQSSTSSGYYIQTTSGQATGGCIGQAIACVQGDVLINPLFGSLAAHFVDNGGKVLRCYEELVGIVLDAVLLTVMLFDIS